MNAKLLLGLGGLGIVLVGGYVVYRCINPKYADFDADFDYDEFEGEFDDLEDEDPED